ncbi:MAG: hypothetical protein ABSG88_13565 [Bradyrhizobium sp.]
MASIGLDQGLNAVDRGFNLEAHARASIGDQSHDGGIIVGDQHPQGLHGEFVCIGHL